MLNLQTQTPPPFVRSDRTMFGMSNFAKMPTLALSYRLAAIAPSFKYRVYLKGLRLLKVGVHDLGMILSNWELKVKSHLR